MALTQQINFVDTADYFSVALGYSSPSLKKSCWGCLQSPTCMQEIAKGNAGSGGHGAAGWAGRRRRSGVSGCTGCGKAAAGSRSWASGRTEGELWPSLPLGYGRSARSLSAPLSHTNPARLTSQKPPLKISPDCHSPANPARSLNAKQVIQLSPSLSGLRQV